MLHSECWIAEYFISFGNRLFFLLISSVRLDDYKTIVYAFDVLFCQNSDFRMDSNGRGILLKYKFHPSTCLLLLHKTIEINCLFILVYFKLDLAIFTYYEATSFSAIQT